MVPTPDTFWSNRISATNAQMIMRLIFSERSKQELPRNSISHQNIEHFEFYSITKTIMHDFGGNFSKYSKYVLMGENRYQNHTYTHQYLILTKMRSKVN